MGEARLVTIVAFIALSLLSIWYFRNFANPPTVALLPWTMVLVAQAIFAPDFPFGLSAAVVLGAAEGSYLLGAFVVGPPRLQPGCVPSGEHVDRLPIPRPYWYSMFTILLVGTMIQNVISYYYLNVLGLGRHTEGAVDPYSLYEAMGMGSGLAYAAVRASTIATYIAAGVFAIAAVEKRRAGFGLILFIAIVGSETLLTSTRTPFLLSLSIICCTITSLSIRQFKRLPRQLFRAAGAGVLLAVAVAVWATVNRYGMSVDDVNSSEFVDKQEVSLLGAPSGLSLFLDRASINPSHSFQGITIAGILAPLGLYQKVQGVYAGLDAEQPLTSRSSATTNQYTGLRLLLEEFGLFGTMMIMAVLGTLTTAVFNAHYSAPTIAKGATLANLYLLVLWLPITLLSYYSFWTIQFIIVVILGKMFFRIQARGSLKGPRYRRGRAGTRVRLRPSPNES
jgi:oligosaccharide repeat unit polymerase